MYEPGTFRVRMQHNLFNRARAHCRTDEYARALQSVEGRECWTTGRFTQNGMPTAYNVVIGDQTYHVPSLWCDEDGWPQCPRCGDPALDGHITCGRVECDEAAARAAGFGYGEAGNPTP